MTPKFLLLTLPSLVAAALLAPGGICAAEVPPARAAEIAQAAEALRPKLVELRRDLHMHPELSNREERTARIVAERLRGLGFDEVRTNVAGHGVVALLRGTKPGPVVALRADMDALPINETIDVPYKSQVPGVKHACGHDAHTAIALGAAELLSQRRNQIRGAVKFLFQPAEEGPPPGEEGGAALMIKQGALDNPRPQAIFGLHTSPEADAGLVGYRAGPAQAAADSFAITIRGRMAHAAMPETGVDSILVAAECITALQSIKSRRMNTFEPIILTVGTIHGGNRQNSLSDEVKMTGTIRTLSEEAQSRVEQLMRETLAGITAGYGATFDLQFDHITTVVFNDPRLVEESLPTLRVTVGPTNVFEAPVRMGAEDFSFYAKVVPGLFLRLGSGNKAKGITANAHTPEFDIDEDCLVVGVKVMANLALDYLDRHATSQ
jgi:amidohydrolase